MAYIINQVADVVGAVSVLVVVCVAGLLAGYRRISLRSLMFAGVLKLLSSLKCPALNSGLCELRISC